MRTSIIFFFLHFWYWQELAWLNHLQLRSQQTVQHWEGKHISGCSEKTRNYSFHVKQVISWFLNTLDHKTDLLPNSPWKGCFQALEIDAKSNQWGKMRLFCLCYVSEQVPTISLKLVIHITHSFTLQSGFQLKDWPKPRGNTKHKGPTKGLRSEGLVSCCPCVYHSLISAVC